MAALVMVSETADGSNEKFNFLGFMLLTIAKLFTYKEKSFSNKNINKTDSGRVSWEKVRN